MRNVTYDRPMAAVLYVRLENGEEWKATRDDLERFGLVERIEAYGRFNDALRDVLARAGLLDDGDVTNTGLNPVRFLAEIAINHPDLLEHPDHEDWKTVVEAERALRAYSLSQLPIHDEPSG